MLGFVDPNEDFIADDFCHLDALRSIDIFYFKERKGRVPVMAGMLLHLVRCIKLSHYCCTKQVANRVGEMVEAAVWFRGSSREVCSPEPDNTSVVFVKIE